MKRSKEFNKKITPLKQACIVDLMVNKKGTFPASEDYVERVKKGFRKNGLYDGIKRIDAYLENNEEDYEGAIAQGRAYAEDLAERWGVDLFPLIDAEN
jgi:hypothetical protein